MKEIKIYKMIIGEQFLEYVLKHPAYYLENLEALRSIGIRTSEKYFLKYPLELYGLLLGNLEIKEKKNIEEKEKISQEIATNGNASDYYYLSYENNNKYVTSEYKDIILQQVINYEVNFFFLEEDHILEVKKLKEEFYTKEGKKRIPENIDKYMSMELISYIYLEIGSIDYSMSLYLLNMTKYEKEEIKRLQKSMEKICGISSELEISDNKKELQIISPLSIKKITTYLTEIRRKWIEMMENEKYGEILGFGEEDKKLFLKSRSTLSMSQYKQLVKKKNKQIPYHLEVEELQVFLEKAEKIKKEKE